MPENYEIEKAYLGAALIDQTVLLANPIDPADFHHFLYRKIYQAMRDVIASGGNIDPVLLASNMPDVGISELLDLMNATVSILNAPDYARQIQKLAERRELFQIASDLANDVTAGDVDPVTYTDKIIRAIRVTGITNSLTEAARNYAEYIERRMNNPSEVWGIATPWDAFNRVTGGLHRKESTLIFGKSGVGKTVAVLQMGYHAAMNGSRVDFYELEMSKENLLSRLAAMHSQVPTKKVHTGNMDSTEKRKVLESLDFIQSLPIRISDATHWTSSEIRADQQKKNSDRADVVIVDYLALLQDRAENSYERVEGAAKNLRSMAKDLDQVLLTVGSQVKDGSIKGTAEVKYAQDMTWFVERTSDDENDPVRDFVPDKLRNVDIFKKVAVTFATTPQGDRLPYFREFNFG